MKLRRVTLCDRSGLPLTTALVEYGAQLPEVIVVGNRYFQLCDDGYREASHARATVDLPREGDVIIEGDCVGGA